MTVVVVVPHAACCCWSKVDLLLDISLSERARLVHPWSLRAPTWKSPPFITCRTFPVVLCSLLYLGTSVRFFLFSSFVSCACVRVFESWHRGRARRRRGCQRVLAGRGGFARSAVAVFVARYCLWLETRGVHESCLADLHL